MMKINDCEIIKDLLPSYVDGLTNETTNAIIEDHLKDCLGCREELKRSGMPVLRRCRQSRTAQR